MPVITGTTKSAKQVWASPDGQKKIFKIVLDIDGADMQASTYSEPIAQVGWTGELDTYEKPGKYGVETFVRQPKKEGFSGGFGGGKGYGKPQGDQYTMYLSYAKDVLVAMMNNGYKPDFNDAMQTIIGGGNMLYESRPNASDVKSEAPTEQPKASEPNHIKEDLDSLFDAAIGGQESQWKS